MARKRGPDGRFLPENPNQQPQDKPKRRATPRRKAVKLHPVTHDPARYRNRFCGPAAFSAITGLTAEDGAAAIREITGKRSVMGVAVSELRKALVAHGWETIPAGRFAHGERPTTAAWIRKRRGEDMRRMFLVVQSTHFIVVKGRKAVDNFVREPVSILKITGRRARVVAVYHLIRL